MNVIATAIIAKDSIYETEIVVQAGIDKFGVHYYVSIETANDARGKCFDSMGGENGFANANEYSRGILAAAFQSDRDVESYLNIGNDR